MPLGDGDYLQFAEDLIAGRGELIFSAWQALGGSDSRRMRQVAGKLMPLVREKLRPGPLRGLLFGDANRFMKDLYLMLRTRAGLVDFLDASRQNRPVIGPYAEFVAGSSLAVGPRIRGPVGLGRPGGRLPELDSPSLKAFFSETVSADTPWNRIQSEYYNRRDADDAAAAGDEAKPLRNWIRDTRFVGQLHHAGPMTAHRQIILLLDATNPYQRKIAQGAADLQRARERELALSRGAGSAGESAVPGTRSAGDFARPAPLAPDGMIAAFHSRSAATAVKTLNVPAVGIEAEYGWGNLSSPIPFFATDNEAIGRCAAEDFIQRGLQRLAFAAFPAPALPAGRSGADWPSPNAGKKQGCLVPSSRAKPRRPSGRSCTRNCRPGCRPWRSRWD